MTALLDEGSQDQEERKPLHIGHGSPSRCRGRATGQMTRGGRSVSERMPFAPMNAPPPLFVPSTDMGQHDTGNSALSSSMSVSSAATTAEDSMSTASSSASAELPMLSGLSLSGPMGMSGWDAASFGAQCQHHQTYPPSHHSLHQQQFLGGALSDDGGSHMLSADAFQQQQPQAKTVECDKDLFAMYVFKVAMCSKQFVHDWKECPYAHEGETARRRHPSHHTAQPCPDFKSSKSCPRGEKCQMAHGPWEAGLHPDAFRTNLCAYGRSCQRRMCFFAHDVSELRSPQPHSLAQHILNVSQQSQLSGPKFAGQNPDFGLGGPALQSNGIGKKTTSPIGTKSRDSFFEGLLKSGLQHHQQSMAVGAERGRTIMQSQQLGQHQQQLQQQQFSGGISSQQRNMFGSQQVEKRDLAVSDESVSIQQQQLAGGISTRRQLQGFAGYNAARLQQLQQHHLQQQGLRVDVPVPNGSPQENPLASTTRSAFTIPFTNHVKPEDTSWVDKLLDSPL